MDCPAPAPAPPPGFVIVVDTREQKPFDFSGGSHPVPTVRARLDTGDYSVLGREDSIAIERKSPEDFLGCLGQSRDRFFRELRRANVSMSFFAVVVEGSFSDLIAGRYQSQIAPNAVAGTCAAIIAQFGIPIIFAGNRISAMIITERLLRQAAAEDESVRT